MAVNPDAVVYQLIGEEGFSRLTRAFYRQVKGDDLLGPMYPEADFEGAERRLKGFLMFRFGGPLTYVEERGHPRLRARHAPFPVDQAARNRWVQLMEAALREVNLPLEPDRILREFFHNTATFLINRQGPMEGGGGAGFAGNPRFPVWEG